jgi:hypothetical protein
MVRYGSFISGTAFGALAEVTLNAVADTRPYLATICTRLHYGKFRWPDNFCAQPRLVSFEPQAALW